MLQAPEPSFAGSRPGPLPAGLAPPRRFCDPDLAIPAGALQRSLRDLPDRISLSGQDGSIPAEPRRPMRALPVAGPGRPRRWRLALAASCILHAAAALSFLSIGDEAVLLEGAELSGVAALGNASEDQLSEGEATEFSNAVEVTMISMLEAAPVTAAEAEMMPTEDVVATVEVETAAVETVQPAEATVAERAEADAPAREAAPVGQAEAVTASAQPAEAISDDAPEILATNRQQVVEDDDIVREILHVQPPIGLEAADPAANDTASEIVETAMALPAEQSDAETATPVAALPPETGEASAAEPVRPVELQPVDSELAETSGILRGLPSPPLPEPRPNVSRTARPVADAKPQGKRSPPPEAELRKKAAKSTAGGNGGRNAANARRGQADGRATGKAASKQSGSRSSAAGNAAVSNYPGKVASKLRRALRYPAAAKRQRLRGQVRVSFVVSASGAVGSVRVVSSSGSSILDGAALDAVRRAAPFPAIPQAAGRSSWPFTVPLAFSR